MDHTRKAWCIFGLRKAIGQGLIRQAEVFYCPPIRKLYLIFHLNPP